jgi:hypothetical protein
MHSNVGANIDKHTPGCQPVLGFQELERRLEFFALPQHTIGQILPDLVGMADKLDSINFPENLDVPVTQKSEYLPDASTAGQQAMKNCVTN